MPRASKTVDRPREEWIEIPVPALVDRRRCSAGPPSAWPTTSASPPATPRSPPCSRAWPPARPAVTATTGPRPGPRTRRSTTTAASAPTTTAMRAGGSAGNQPVRADYLDQVVWDHITALLADPALIRGEISKRLAAARTSDPVTSQRKRLQAALAKATASITAMIERVLRAAPHHRRATRPDAAPPRPRDRPARTSSTPSTPRPPTGTPTSSSPMTSKASSPSSAGNAAIATVEDRQRVLRAARQGHPHRPGENHHPAPHPRPPRQLRRPSSRPRTRHGG